MGILSVIESTARKNDSDSNMTSPRATRIEKMATEINIYGMLCITTVAMVGGFLYGFDIGATSFVIVMLLNPPEIENSSVTYWWLNLSSTRQGLIVSGLSLGALIGSIVLISLSRHIGRRMELRLCAMFYMIGTVLNVTSGTVLKERSVGGFLCLCLGRVLYGIGVGFVMHGAPAYLAEMSPHRIRGAVVSAKETVIVGGIVAGYMVGNNMSTDPLGWIKLYGLCGLMALPMFALTYYVPRSTRWLLMHGLHQEAYESMKFMYIGNFKNEYEALVNGVCAGKKSTSTTTDYREPSLFELRYRKAIFASMGLIFFQQFSGQPSVLSYSTVLFQAAGWSGDACVVSSVLMMITSAVTVLLVERAGRKFLLCTGCLVMMVALSALSISFWGWGENVDVEVRDSDSTQKLVILCAMFFYIAGYQIGFGPITWCIVSETSPIEIRGEAIALGVILNYFLNFCVQFLFPTLQETLGWGRTFCFFGVVLAFAFFFIRTYVPETTGLTLEEIGAQIAADKDTEDDRKGAKRYQFREDKCPTEETNLLGVRSSSFFGAHPSLEEMETQLIRTSSGSALDTNRNKTR